MVQSVVWRGPQLESQCRGRRGPRSRVEDTNSMTNRHDQAKRGAGYRSRSFTAAWALFTRSGVTRHLQLGNAPGRKFSKRDAPRTVGARRSASGAPSRRPGFASCTVAPRVIALPQRSRPWTASSPIQAGNAAPHHVHAQCQHSVKKARDAPSRVRRQPPRAPAAPLENSKDHRTLREDQGPRFQGFSTGSKGSRVWF